MGEKGHRTEEMTQEEFETNELVALGLILAFVILFVTVVGLIALKG